MSDGGGSGNGAAAVAVVDGASLVKCAGGPFLKDIAPERLRSTFIAHETLQVVKH